MAKSQAQSPTGVKKERVITYSYLRKCKVLLLDAIAFNERLRAANK